MARNNEQKYVRLAEHLENILNQTREKFIEDRILGSIVMPENVDVLTLVTSREIAREIKQNIGPRK